jgi:hypothetical protein
MNVIDYIMITYNLRNGRLQLHPITIDYDYKLRLSHVWLRLSMTDGDIVNKVG